MEEGLDQSWGAESRRRIQGEGLKVDGSSKDALFRWQVELGLHELTAALSSLSRRVGALEESAALGERDHDQDEVFKGLTHNARCISQALPDIASARSRRSALRGYFRESDDQREGGGQMIDPATRVLVVEGLACLAGKVNADADRRSVTNGCDDSTRVDVSPSHREWRRKDQRNDGGNDQIPHQPTPTQQRRDFFERASSCDEMQMGCSPGRLEIGDLYVNPAPSGLMDPAPGAGVGLSSSHQLPSTHFSQRETSGEGATLVRSSISDQRVHSGREEEIFARQRLNVNCSCPDRYFSTSASPPAREADVKYTEGSTISRVDGVPKAARSAGKSKARADKAEVGQAAALRAAPASEPGRLLEGFKSGNLGNSVRGAAERSSVSDPEWLTRLFVMDTARSAAETVTHQGKPQQIRNDERWAAGDLEGIHGVRVDEDGGKFRRVMEGVRSLSPAPLPSHAPTVSSFSASFDCHRRRRPGVESVTSDGSRPAFDRVAMDSGARRCGKNNRCGQSMATSRGMGGLQPSRGDGWHDRVDNQEGEAATPPGKPKGKGKGSLPHSKGVGEETEKPPKITMDAALVEAWRRSSGASSGKPTVDAQGFADLGASSAGGADTCCGFLGVSEDDIASVDTTLPRQPATRVPWEGLQVGRTVNPTGTAKASELAGEECPPSLAPRPDDHEGTTPLLSQLMALPFPEQLRCEFEESLALHLADYGNPDESDRGCHGALPAVKEETGLSTKPGTRTREAGAAAASGATGDTYHGDRSRRTDGGDGYDFIREVSLLMSKRGSNKSVDAKRSGDTAAFGGGESHRVSAPIPADIAERIFDSCAVDGGSKASVPGKGSGKTERSDTVGGKISGYR